ncbi:hypothetical protein L6Q21_09735 [Sandaracinobacter sp. RS1-74]|uniref:hypothetical protein n=1 Tax=Sandaracinobacteroides sayramensis TaxID=2913411 RepID=UPI001EDB0DF7|nr:hypothetical protein [Sandaracinobacteroides sayramensis]MCG2841260.1 hypothetical protein [Sandaracinobacteroides sayramensis]
MAQSANHALARGLQLVSDLPNIIVTLSEPEYDAATIFAFDPDASLPAGGLIPNCTLDPEQPLYRLPGGLFDRPTWLRLARACTGEADDLTDQDCLAAFLAARVVINPAAAVPATAE